MKKHYLPILLTLLTHSLFSQATWEAFPSGYNAPVTVWDVEVVDQANIWTCSMKGTFNNNVWSISPSNLISKTTDGGITWAEMEVPVPLANWGVSNISAIDGQTAWLAMYSFAGPGDVYRTTNGGTTWDNLDATTQFTNAVHFWDENRGVAMADPEGGYFEIVLTEDGGDTWMRVPSANIPPPLSAQEAGAFGVYAVFDSHIWFGTSSGRVFHSADYGLNWDAAQTAIGLTGYPSVEGITFRDALHGFAHSAVYNSVPFQATMVITDDGGDTWTEVVADDNDYSIFQAQYIPNSEYLMKTSRASNGAGPFVTSLSTNDGATWLDVDGEAPIMRFEFTTPSYGWGGKFKNNNDPTMMYRYAGDPLSGILSQQALEADLSISPNPCSDMFRVKVAAPTASDFLLLVNDPNGRLLRREIIENEAEFQRHIDLGGLPAGLYSVTLSNAEGSLSTKVLKR